MKWPLYKDVTLLKDVPEEGMKKGDLVTTVDFLEGRHGLPNGYCVDAFDPFDKTIAVFVARESDIEAPTNYDVVNKRRYINMQKSDKR